MARARKLITAFLGALLFFGGGASALAQSPESIKIQPAIIETRLEPGQLYRNSIRVTNVTQATRTFYLSARDILNIGADGQPVFAEPGQTVDTGVSSWVKLADKSVTLGPGESKDVFFTITAPKDAYPGGHFGGIFLALTADPLSETGSAIGYEVGTLLNIRTAGEAIVQARILEFRSDKSLYSDETAVFGARVENLGNVLIRPQGFVEVSNMFGKKVATLIVNEEGAGIFPKSERAFAATWNPERFSFGRYEAILSLSYGDDARKTVTTSLSIWVIPLQLVIGVLVGVIVIVGGGYLFLRWYIRKKIGEAGGAVRDRGSRPFPRLLFLTLATLGFTLVFLVLLFVLFSA